MSFIDLWSQSASFKIPLSVFKSFFPISTNCHESWILTETVLSQAQVAELGFLCRVYGVTFAIKL